MNVAYCTFEDVYEFVVEYRNSIDTEEVGTGVDRTNSKLIKKQEILNIIEEATQHIRNKLQPHYDLTTIDYTYPNLPIVIRSFCKTYSAILIYQRYRLSNGSKASEVIDLFKKNIEDYERAIIGHILEDPYGAKIPAIQSPTLLKQPRGFASGLKDIWKNGRQY